MKLKDKWLQFMDMIRGEADEQSASRHETMSNLSTGGYAGYRPNQQERRRRRPRSVPEQTGQEYVGQQPWGPQMQPQPVDGSQGWMQPQQPFMGAGQPDQMPPMGYEPPQMMSGAYQQGWSGPQMTPPAAMGYQPPVQGMPMDNGYVEQSAPQPMPDNMIVMPGMQRDAQGAVWRHREIIAQPLSAATCYRLIEFMSKGMTVIVNTELIQDQREVQRCLDLLFGAAFTMNCGFHRIAARSLYMITPSDVQVDAYENIRQESNEDIRQRWPNASGVLFPEREKRAQPTGYRSRESFAAGGSFAAGRG